MRGAYNYIIYRDPPEGGEYHVERANGTDLISPGASAYQAFQAALKQKLYESTGPDAVAGPGKIYIADGVYSFDDDLTLAGGLQLYPRTRLTMSPNARLLVPNGYAGSALMIKSLESDTEQMEDIVIEGGWIDETKDEAGNRGRQWTALLLQASATTQQNGIEFNVFQNMTIMNASTAIRLLVDGGPTGMGNVNANTFRSLHMSDCVTFVQFDITSPKGNQSKVPYFAGEEDWGIVRNLFDDVQCQVGPKPGTPVTKYGLTGTTATSDLPEIGVTGAGNVFLNVSIWDIRPDLVPGAQRAIIGKIASKTLIIAGIISDRENGVFTDNSSSTRIMDEFTGLSFPPQIMPS